MCGSKVIMLIGFVTEQWVELKSDCDNDWVRMNSPVQYAR